MDGDGKHEANVVVDLTVSDDGENDEVENQNNAGVSSLPSNSDVANSRSERVRGLDDENAGSNHHSFKRRKTVICIDVDQDSDEGQLGEHNDDGLSQSQASTQVPLHVQIDQSEGVDFGIVSSGIHLPPSCLASNVLTCSGKSNANTTNNRTTYKNVGALTHLQQKDKWSCGFRNMQMLLATVLPSMAPSHPFFRIQPQPLPIPTNNHVTQPQQQPNPNENVISIPSIRQIQANMEIAWEKGFDSKGAQFFRNKIIGKKSKIGALEASSILSYWHIDSTVVQFIVCRESRRMLGEFVWKYFQVGHTESGADTNDSYVAAALGSCWRTRNHDIATALGTRGLVEDIMASIEHDDAQNKHELLPSTNIIQIQAHPPIYPLYLQWEGHSVTIVGIERTKLPNHSSNSFNLLVFDPMKNFMGLKHHNGGKGPSKWEGIERMRLSTRTTMTKDCQVIVISPNALGEEDRENRRNDENASVVTAAGEKVMEAVHRNHPLC